MPFSREELIDIRSALVFYIQQNEIDAATERHAELKSILGKLETLSTSKPKNTD